MPDIAKIKHNFEMLAMKLLALRGTLRGDRNLGGWEAQTPKLVVASGS